MKTISVFKIFFICGLIFIGLSCDKSDSNVNVKAVQKTISGKWEFTLSPNISIPDTTLIKGIRPSEEEEYPAIIDEVYLYQNDKGDIEGQHGLVSFQGTIRGNNIKLEIYGHQRGIVSHTEDVSEMEHISSMELELDDFGRMKGNGSYFDNPGQSMTSEESYFVEAIKKGDITNESELKETQINIKEILCNIRASIDSFVIGKLTGNLFRPIGNCYLNKNGGGYYLFGETGPGSMLPFYTQTIYYPYEWSWCKTRKYDFDIKMKGEIFSLEALKWLAEHDAPTPDYYGVIGYESVEVFNDLMQDFYDKFGGFAISLGYSSNSGNLSIYVNHKVGNGEEAINHEFITKLATALNPHVNTIDKFHGVNISDYWHLRRSDFTHCNTPVLFCYLVGTHDIYYD